jgi:chemosensory pili system protein ChpE
MAASFSWCFVCAAFVHYLFSRVGPSWVRITYRACAIVFLVLALFSLWDLVREFGDRPRIGVNIFKMARNSR